MIKFPSARQQSLFMEMKTDSYLLFSMAFIPGRHYIYQYADTIKKSNFFTIFLSKKTLCDRINMFR